MSALHDDHAHEQAGHAHQTSYDSFGEFTEAYLQILLDPAHLAAEVTLFLLLDVVILGLLWSKIAKRKLARAHAEIDEEHGYVHDENDPAVVRSTRRRRSDVILTRG